MSYPDTVDADFAARVSQAAVDELQLTRWSPRAFVKTPIAPADVESLFEAARWAPSCFNDQPWQFYVSTEDSFADYLALLLEGNQVWAKNASLLCFAVVRKQFAHNGKDNAYARFDAGAAWMALTLQARRLGLYTHAMGGIKHQDVAGFLGLSDAYEVVCGIAIGVAAQPDTLPAELAGKEKPSGRKPLAEVLIRK